MRPATAGGFFRVMLLVFLMFLPSIVASAQGETLLRLEGQSLSGKLIVHPMTFMERLPCNWRMGITIPEGFRG